MIDSFKFTARAIDFGLDYFELGQEFNRKRIQKKKSTIYSYDFRGINVWCYGFSTKTGPSYIEVEGSLDKFLNGDNAQNTSRLTVQEALIKLSKLFRLKVPESVNRFGYITLLDFKVQRLDFGINIPMEKNVEDYLSLIDGFPRYSRKRNDYPNEVLFRSKSQSKSVIFYDKSLEFEYNRDKYSYKYHCANLDGPKHEIPKNTLRLEYRVLQYAGGVLKIDNVRDLGKKANVKRLYEKLSKTYNTTIKYEEITFDTDLTISQLEKGLIYNGIQSIGGFDSFDHMLNVYKKRKVKYVGPERIKAFNRKVKESRKVEAIFKNPDEIKEMNVKFKERINLAKNGFYVSKPHPEFVQKEGDWVLKNPEGVFADLIV